MASTMTYDEFRPLIKSGGLSQLYLFTGEEDFLLEFCIDETKKALINPSFEDFNCKFYIEAPSFEDASSFIGALPLMSEKKLVVFNNCSLFDRRLSEKNRWAELFLSLPPYVVVIIRERGEGKGAATDVKKAVTKAAQTVTFDFMPEARLKPWLIRFAASRGKSLSAQNASYIISSVGRSMTLLRAETEKIAAKAEEFEITKKDIDSVIIKPLTENVFRMTDAIFAARRDLAYASAASLQAAKQEGAAVISLIASQVLNVYKAKLLMSQGKSISEVKRELGGGFKADKAVSNASKVTLVQLENLIHFLAEADMSVKTGAMDAWCAVDLAIAL